MDAYHAQMLVLNSSATTALAMASATSRRPQLRLVHKMTRWSRLSFTMGGRYGSIQFVRSITPATASEMREDLIMMKCGSLVMIVVTPATMTRITLTYCNG